MSIVQKIDAGTLIFLNPTDRLRSASDDRLPMIINETSDDDIAKSFDKLHDNTCFSILTYLSNKRLLSVIFLLKDYQLANIFSWENNEVLTRVLTSFSGKGDEQSYLRVFSVLDKPFLIRALSNVTSPVLISILTAVITEDTGKDKVLRINQVISALLSCNRLIEVLQDMPDEHIATMFPLVYSHELNKIIPLMSGDMLARVLPMLDDVILGYILSTTNCLSLVRSLLKVKQ